MCIPSKEHVCPALDRKRFLIRKPGIGIRVITNDAENRPLSVNYAGNLTEYVYGADGSRLKKVEKAGTGSETTTLYFGGVEIRDPGVGETILLYPNDAVRFKYEGVSPVGR